MSDCSDLNKRWDDFHWAMDGKKLYVNKGGEEWYCGKPNFKRGISGDDTKVLFWVGGRCGPDVCLRLSKALEVDYTDLMK